MPNASPPHSFYNPLCTSRMLLTTLVAKATKIEISHSSKAERTERQKEIWTVPIAFYCHLVLGLWHGLWPFCEFCGRSAHTALLTGLTPHRRRAWGRSQGGC